MNPDMHINIFTFATREDLNKLYLSLVSLEKQLPRSKWPCGVRPVVFHGGDLKEKDFREFRVLLQHIDCRDPEEGLAAGMDELIVRGEDQAILYRPGTIFNGPLDELLKPPLDEDICLVGAPYYVLPVEHEIHKAYRYYDSQFLERTANGVRYLSSNLLFMRLKQLRSEHWLRGRTFRNAYYAKRRPVNYDFTRFINDYEGQRGLMPNTVVYHGDLIMPMDSAFYSEGLKMSRGAAVVIPPLEILEGALPIGSMAQYPWHQMAMSLQGSKIPFVKRTRQKYTEMGKRYDYIPKLYGEVADGARRMMELWRNSGLSSFNEDGKVIRNPTLKTFIEKNEAPAQ